MLRHHSNEWKTIVLKHKLKGWETIDEKLSSHQEGHQMGGKTNQRKKPFMLEGFYEHLVRWIAVDDQAC